MGGTARRTGQRARGVALLVGAVLLALVAVAFPAPVRAAACVVTSTADNGSAGTLRTAVNNASCDTITFAASTNGTITLTGGRLLVTRAVTITGNGAANTIIAQTTNADVFTVSAPGAAPVAFVALTLRGGFTGIQSSTTGNNGNAAVTVTDVAVTGNSTGIYANVGSVRIVGSTVSGNTDYGIYSAGVPFAVTNSTVSGNNIGVYGDFGTTTTVTGSIVAGSTGSNGNCFLIGDTFTDGGHNLEYGTSGSSGTCDFAASAQTGDPKLAPLGAYGGPTQTQPPQAGSAAIDKGGATCPATDQRGITRPRGAKCDIGAVEANTASVVNNVGDGAADATRCYDPAMLTCRLRDAIAATDDEGTITFSAAVFPPMGAAQTITLAAGQLTVQQSVTITGPGAGVLTVNGNNASRVFNITACSCATVEISGLTITGGNARNGGGGILSQSVLTLKKVVVRDNKSPNGNGGGIRNIGTLIVEDSTISGNSADDGGGIRNAGNALITRTTISGNQATGGIGSAGGGISNSAFVLLANVTISGNSAVANGGGIRNSAFVSLANVTISGNTAAAGAGIRNQGAINARNSIIAGNTSEDLNNTGSGTLDPTSLNNLIATTIAPINPLLAPLGSYGGPTQTRPPLPGSPALDAGDNTACAGIAPAAKGGADNLDQRGFPRPVNTTCDIGAVEIRGFTLNVTAVSTPQTATAGAAFADRLEVTLIETGGSPLPGATVTFTAVPALNGASAALTTSPATTDMNGKASVAATANFVAGMYPVAANAGGTTGATFSLTNTAPTITVTPATLLTGVVGSVYPAQMFGASGGTVPHTFAVVPTMNQQLPPGLMLVGTTLSGTPTTAGMFTFTLRATDANAFTGDRTYTVTINAAVAVAPATLPNGTVGVAYSRTVSVTGGTGTGYTFAATGTLPPGLTLAANGTLSGTPTTAGMFTFTATATDNGTNSGSRPYTVTILSVVAVAPASLPNGTVGVAYTQMLTATGGTGTGYSFAATGMLPPGLMLATNGTLSGTPTTVGMFAFTVAATDSGTNTGSRPYTMIVGTATVTGVTITRASGGTVTGGMANMPAGGTMQLALTATFTDGAMQPITSGVTYTSGDTSKATVDATGRVTGLSPGMVTITATYMGRTTTFTLTITAPGSGGLMPNPAPVVRPDAATAPAQATPQAAPPTRAAATAAGGIGPQGNGTATPPPRPAPPMR